MSEAIAEMSMFRTLIPAVVLAAIAFTTPAIASVEYKFDGEFLTRFDLTVPSFITTDETFDAQTSGCTLFENSCSVEFVPGTQSDTLNFFIDNSQTSFLATRVAAAAVDPDATYTFAPGSFTTPGLHLSTGEDIGTLDVISAVPLPASAPLFGAALLALGAAGFGLNRKAKAAA